MVNPLALCVALNSYLLEAENLLEKSELPKLADFYRALVDAYPGHEHVYAISFNIYLMGACPTVASIQKCQVFICPLPSF